MVSGTRQLAPVSKKQAPETGARKCSMCHQLNYGDWLTDRGVVKTA